MRCGGSRPDQPDWVGQRVVFYPGTDWGNDERVQSSEYAILGLPMDGTFREEAVLPTELLYRAPAHLSDEAAAALPLAGVTAWRALITRGSLREGERVLVTGIGGGVALMAAQLAFSHGAEVYVTSGCHEKLNRALSLGAIGAVNYHEEDWAQRLHAMVPGGFDVIIDSAGGSGFGHLARLLSRWSAGVLWRNAG